MSQDNLARLPRPASEAPALGMSIQVDLGAGRVATLQTFVPSDCSLPDLNRMLDKMTAAGDRQRAHYQIEELERSLATAQKEQGQHKEDLERIDREYEAAQAQRKAQAERAVKSLEDYDKHAAALHEERGRRGPVVLKGADKANVDRVKAGIVKLQGEMQTATAEHDVAHANSQATFDRRAQLIADAEEKLARCRAIVAAGLKE